MLWKRVGAYYSTSKNRKITAPGRCPFTSASPSTEKKKELSTQCKIEPEKWSAGAQKANSRTEAVKAVNDYLDVLHTKAIQARTKLVSLGKPVTADNIRILVQDKPFEVHTIVEAFKEHNDRMRKLIGIDYSEGTMERFDVSLRHTIAFMQDAYKISDIDVTKIDFDYVQAYEVWLKKERSCSHNTAMKYISNFKKSY